jgi:hypothetical protein
VPLVVFALAVAGYLFGGLFETLGSPVVAVIVMGFGQSLPFVGIALLGWVLLKGSRSRRRPPRCVGRCGKDRKACDEARRLGRAAA